MTQMGCLMNKTRSRRVPPYEHGSAQGFSLLKGGFNHCSRLHKPDGCHEAFGPLIYLKNKSFFFCRGGGCICECILADTILARGSSAGPEPAWQMDARLHGLDSYRASNSKRR